VPTLHKIQTELNSTQYQLIVQYVSMCHGTNHNSPAPSPGSCYQNITKMNYEPTYCLH